MRVPEHVHKKRERLLRMQANQKLKSTGYPWLQNGQVGRFEPSTDSPSTAVGIEQQVPSREFDDFHKRIDDRLIARVGKGGGYAESSRWAARHRCGIERRA